MLEHLLKGALQGFGGPGAAAGGTHPLLQMLVSMLQNNGQFGGLAGLVDQFRQAGLGQQVDSWVGMGQNLPVSADQLGQAFGAERLQQMAGQAGMDPSQLGGLLAQLLPQVVDQLTPQGQVPSSGVDDALRSLGSLGALFGGR